MISVIVPVVNEAGNLVRQMPSLQELARIREILVVDGMSEDSTDKTVRSMGLKLVRSRYRQRAYQMNLGAMKASAEILLFLHADTLIDQRHIDAIVHAVHDQHHVGGAFRRRFDGRSPVLSLTTRLADLRGLAFGHYFGDQAIFASTHAFRAIDGYANLDQFEDLDLAIRLRQLGSTRLIGPSILSSARRFRRRGTLPQTLLDTIATLRYLRSR